jgi:hypothetical protein
MQAMVSLGVEHSNYNDVAAFDPVKELVRKSMRWHPPKTAVIDSVPFGRILEQTEGTVNLVK